MTTFKNFLTEDAAPYYGDYPVLRTHKGNIEAFKKRMSTAFDIPTFRFKIHPYLIDNKPTFRFKFDISLAKEHTDPELIGKMLQNFAKKDLQQDYPKVTVKSDVEPFKGFNGVQRVLFSLASHGEQRK